MAELALWCGARASLVAVRGLSCGELWDLSSPTRDRTRAPLHWERGVLTTGPPGKSLTADILQVLVWNQYCLNNVHNDSHSQRPSGVELSIIFKILALIFIYIFTYVYFDHMIYFLKIS